MCRWPAYTGSPVSLEDLLFTPTNALVVQSKHSRLGVETTNGDGDGWCRSRSLFRSADVSALRAQYPDHAVLQDVSEDSRMVVSEPLGELRGAWQEVPESTCVVVHRGAVDLFPFTPLAASAAPRDVPRGVAARPRVPGRPGGGPTRPRAPSTGCASPADVVHWWSDPRTTHREDAEMSRRTPWSLLSAAALALAALTGCDTTAEDVEEGAGRVQQEVEEGAEQVEEGAGQVQQDVEEGAGRVQQEVEEGADDAQDDEG